MAGTITGVEYDFKLLVAQTLSTGLDLIVSAPKITIGTSNSGSIAAGGTPPFTTVWSDSRTLAGASETLDLTNLTDGLFSAVTTFAGLRINFIKIVAASGNNATGLTVKFGATEGYNLFGASGRVTIPPGGIVMAMYNDNNSTDIVNSTNDKIDVSGTAADVYSILLVGG